MSPKYSENYVFQKQRLPYPFLNLQYLDIYLNIDDKIECDSNRKCITKITKHGIHQNNKTWQSGIPGDPGIYLASKRAKHDILGYLVI